MARHAGVLMTALLLEGENKRLTAATSTEVSTATFTEGPPDKTVNPFFAQVAVVWYGGRRDVPFEHEEAVLFDQAPAHAFGGRVGYRHDLVRGNGLPGRKPLP